MTSGKPLLERSCPMGVVPLCPVAILRRRAKSKPHSKPFFRPQSYFRSCGARRKWLKGYSSALNDCPFPMGFPKRLVRMGANNGDVQDGVVVWVY